MALFINGGSVQIFFRDLHLLSFLLAEAAVVTQVGHLDAAAANKHGLEYILELAGLVILKVEVHLHELLRKGIFFSHLQLMEQRLQINPDSLLCVLRGRRKFVVEGRELRAQVSECAGKDLLVAYRVGPQYLRNLRDRLKRRLDVIRR